MKKCRSVVYVAQPKPYTRLIYLRSVRGLARTRRLFILVALLALCVCVCARARTCVCLYVFMWFFFFVVCMYVCMYVCVCMHVCMHICMYAWMHVYVCMYACMHVCMYAYVRMYVCMYVCIFVCTHIFLAENKQQPSMHVSISCVHNRRTANISRESYLNKPLLHNNLKARVARTSRVRTTLPITASAATLILPPSAVPESARRQARAPSAWITAPVDDVSNVVAQKLQNKNDLLTALVGHTVH
jgi:hypothetical protein